MESSEIFKKLWGIYTSQNPAVSKIHDSFTKLGEAIENDHIAFRTFNDDRVNLDIIAKPFIEAGYAACNEYYFKEKNLVAKHYEHTSDSKQPRVFISQLLTEAFSDELQQIVSTQLNSINSSIYESKNLIFSGNVWGIPSYKTYHKLREESEYAAWLYVYGFRANHFTVSINNLKQFTSIEQVNDHIKQKGFPLNSSGGEIKGTKQDLLQQSSTIADSVPVNFIEGVYEIPGCYYEFAIRYPNDNGDLFSGFLAKSADKIFESTDFHS